MSRSIDIPTVIYGCRVKAFGWPANSEDVVFWGATVCEGKRGGFWLTLCADNWSPIRREFYEELGLAKAEAEHLYKVDWGPI